MKLPNINYILSNNSVIIAYVARLFCEHTFLRLLISPLYWSTLSFDYVFLYGTLQHVFSLVVGSLHYQHLKKHASLEFITPALLLHPTNNNKKNHFTTLFSICNFFLTCATLICYCLLLNKLATSNHLSILALAFLWRVNPSSTSIIPRKITAEACTSLCYYLHWPASLYKPRTLAPGITLCRKTTFSL